MNFKNEQKKNIGDYCYQEKAVYPNKFCEFQSTLKSLAYTTNVISNQGVAQKYLPLHKWGTITVLNMFISDCLYLWGLFGIIGMDVTMNMFGL